MPHTADRVTVAASGTSVSISPADADPAAAGHLVALAPGANTVTVAVTTYGAWEHIEFSVSFNKPVTVTGEPTFSFDLGGTTKTAAYQEGSETNTLVFSCQVMPGDTDILVGDRSFKLAPDDRILRR